jgi:hypothetical protein
MQHGARFDGARAFLRGEGWFNRHNILVSGQTLYSYGYHFPMATKLPGGGVWVNSAKASVTTSKHQSGLRDTLASEGYVNTGEPATYCGFDGTIWRSN